VWPCLGLHQSPLVLDGDWRGLDGFAWSVAPSISCQACFLQGDQEDLGDPKFGHPFYLFKAPS
jgi:hypothetical protein